MKVFIPAGFSFIGTGLPKADFIQQVQLYYLQNYKLQEENINHIHPLVSNIFAPTPEGNIAKAQELCYSRATNSISIQSWFFCEKFPSPADGWVLAFDTKEKSSDEKQTFTAGGSVVNPDNPYTSYTL